MKLLQHLVTPAATILAMVVLGLTVGCLYPVREHGRFQGYGHEQERGPGPFRGQEEHRPEFRPI